MFICILYNFKEHFKTLMGNIFQNYQIELTYILRVFIAGVCGLIVGIERTKRQKEAGLRTHFIVSASAALIMCLSLTFKDDPVRIAAQIIPGIGFLGAGVIIFRREAVHGLTTAAGVFAIAAIGMTIGAGMYFLGFGGTIIILGCQWILHAHFLGKKTKFHLILIKFYFSDQTISLLKQYFEIKDFERYKATEINGRIVIETVIRTHNECGPNSLTHVMLNNKDIFHIERLED